MTDKRNERQLPSPELMNVSELAAKLGRSRSWVYRAIDQGLVPAGIRLGHRRTWRASVIETWIEQGCPQTGRNSR